jgi:hypothetical protein
VLFSLVMQYFVGDFLGFHSGVAEVSILLRYDPVSVDNLSPPTLQGLDILNLEYAITTFACTVGSDYLLTLHYIPQEQKPEYLIFSYMQLTCPTELQRAHFKLHHVQNLYCGMFQNCSEHASQLR